MSTREISTQEMSPRDMSPWDKLLKSVTIGHLMEVYELNILFLSFTFQIQPNAASLAHIMWLEKFASPQEIVKTSQLPQESSIQVLSREIVFSVLSYYKVTIIRP